MSQKPMKLSFLDFAFQLMSAPERPMDFAFILKLKNGISLERLETGAALAFSAYPKAACKISGCEWVPDGLEWKIQEVAPSTDWKTLLGKPFDLERERGIRQYLRRSGSDSGSDFGSGSGADGPVELFTHMHHAVGDGLSLFFWLQAQLDGVTAAAAAPKMRLKSHAKPKKKSAYSFSRPSSPFHARHAHHDARHSPSPSPARMWTTLTLDRPKLEAHPFTNNDLLCAVILKSIREWKNAVNAPGEKRISLWMPTNVREQPFAAFGNGASRIRVYDRFRPETSMQELAAGVREQVKWSKAHGEWHIPIDLERLTHLPRWLVGGLVKLYANRPWVDMGTVMFSHMERFEGSERFFENVERLEVVAPLDRHHSLAIVGVGFEGGTRLSLTWDPALLDADEVRAFGDIMLANQRQALDEIGAALING